MQLAHQCCCGCSLSFGAYFLLSLNLLRCLLFISMACDAVLHQEQDLYIQIEGSLGEKVALAAFSIAGATFTVFALWGVYFRTVQAVQLAWCFFVVQYLLDIGVIAWENLIHAGCNDIPASLASNAAHPFACGVERVVWLAFLVMAILIEGYFLFILQSYCQDVVVHLPTKAFGDLYEKSEAHILKKHLNPYSHLYGALPGHSELAGEAVMAGVSLHDSYTIFGENHDMSFPPGS
mmetsp:Transcript_114224/g.160249  ORF Transcript_114224/g.160249 Transcript_114224/m.160249 type:complete len:235 (-) Transcript_114224:59-763(-)